MFYPELKRLTVKSHKRNAFGGLVKNSYVPETSFRDILNFTSDSFPLLSVRKPRGSWAGVLTEYGERVHCPYMTFSASGVTAVNKVNGKICFCTGEGINVNGRMVKDVKLRSDVNVRTIVPMGRSLFVVPDGVYVRNTDDGLEAELCDIPEMDFAVERNNRIWGCRFGLNKEGAFVNEIYASALGDPTNFTVFEGISTDPYIANLGCSGEFTGVSVLGNEVLFFKEDFIIRVSGDTPSDFTVTSIPARGVEKGAHLSVVNLNEQIFYKSRNGIMVFDGALPVCISESLGEMFFTDAVSGECSGKYYIAMTEEDGSRYIYVYDTKTSLWHKEDDTDPTKFMITVDGCLYFIKYMFSTEAAGIVTTSYAFILYNVEKVSKAVNILSSADEFEGYEYLPEAPVKWYAETGNIGEGDNPLRQYVRSLSLTLSLGESAFFSLYILPDGTDEWKRLCYIDKARDGVFTVPVSTPSCHSFRLRFEGEGPFTLYSLTRKTETSSEVRGIG